MSHLTGSISLYDCFDFINVAWVVTDHDEPDDGLYRRSAGTDQVEGVGSTSHKDWLREALESLIETL